MTMTRDQLLQKYNSMDLRLRKLHLDTTRYAEFDNRRHVFGVLRMQVIWTESMIAIMKGIETGEISDKLAHFIFGVPSSGQKDFFGQFFLLSRLAFISNFNFQIENFFKTLLVELGIKNIPRGYYNIVKEVLTKTKMPYAQKKLDILYALAMIRNSFHSNGIHSESTKSITINGMPFHFIKGKKVYVNYDKLTVIIDEIISILEEIVNSAVVKKITKEIPMLYIPK
jgi:hypothetical protein